ncbi:universal stress protein, partial [Streptomyces sp. McG5]
MSTLPVIAAVDGSDDSTRALEWALEEARLREAPLRIVHAVRTATPRGAEPPAGAARGGGADGVDDAQGGL